MGLILVHVNKKKWNFECFKRKWAPAKGIKRRFQYPNLSNSETDIKEK